MTEHTLKRFDEELDELASLINSMFKIIRKNIKQAVKAMFDGDLELASRVIKQDEAANALEVQADEVARNLIIRHQPTASDLRFVFAATKIVTDLERMSDLAAGISKIVIDTKGVLPTRNASIPAIQELLLNQLKNVRLAYKNRDVHRAQQVIEYDQLINDEFANSQRVMLTYMAENPSAISSCMALTNIAKALERIGDHATNIAEMVIYMAIGHEVRHIDLMKLKEFLETEEDDDA